MATRTSMTPAARRAASRLGALSCALFLLMLGTMYAIGGDGPAPATYTPSGPPTITTDQADYPPGATVTLTGTNWYAGEAVHIFVNDDEGQTWNHSSDPDPVADEGGVFTYQFSLPGWFVANYTVIATGPLSGTATTTFTDLSIGLYDQCSNDDGDGYVSPPSNLGCHWTNGNLQSNNSTYFEGDATVQRLWLTDLVPGDSVTVTLEYGTTKGAKHAYDFLTTWDFSESWITLADRCEDITGCTTTAETSIAMGDDPLVSNSIEEAGQFFVMRGGTLTDATDPVLVSGVYGTGDSETAVTITFTVASSGDMCSTKNGVTTCDVALWFGAHIAETADWTGPAGDGFPGAQAVPGSPYHVKLAALDGNSIGQRDNQMQANALGGTIVIVKDAVPDSDTNFEFSLEGQINFFLDDDADATLPTSMSFDVPAGDYDAAELVPPAGWDLTNIVCVDPDSQSTVDIDAGTAVIDVDSGETVTCTFTNNKDATLQVIKVANPDSSQSFTINLGGSGLPASVGLVDDGAGAGVDNATYTFTTGQFGSKTLNETVPTGWSLASANCTGGTDTDAALNGITLDVQPGATIVCTFTNNKDGTVTVTKTVSGGLPNGWTFDFEIRTGASLTETGSAVAGGTATTDPVTGETDFGGLLLVPGIYQFCEVNMLPGWHSNLSDEPGAFVPNSDDPNVDNSVVCVEFTLDAGEEEHFDVDNTPPPGGDARTIGFWKNWTSCDGRGNQDPVLDQTLALFPIAAGQSTHGVWIGDIYVDTCEEAIAILNKSTLNGKKKANDAAYGLAAQLLAAVLNYQAGAGQCADATNAIADAQQLLDDVNFTATGNYLGPKVKGALAVQRAEALDLAETLDLYNNNLLC